MNCSIAIYPDAQYKEKLGVWDKYMKLSSVYGFNEVFSTLHLPEFSLSQQVEMLASLAGLVKNNQMELTVDIGGSHINQLLDDDELSQSIRKMGIDFIRLDYGFSVAQIKKMYQSWGIRGFVVNASLLSKSEVELLLMNFSDINSEMEIRACHNFYPRPETGLDDEFIRSQNEIFTQFGIVVYGCIPSLEHPRLPLFQGLPTVEHHRRMNLEQLVCQLIYDYGNGGVLAADEFFSEEQLAVIDRIIRQEPLRLRVKLDADISKNEREGIIKRVHHIRYDSNRVALRSQSSREMSQYGRQVEPRNSGIRKPGSITVDNEAYGRYSGEIQFVLSELEADVRVNIAGQIWEEDIWKLQYFRCGFDYICVEM